MPVDFANPTPQSCTRLDVRIAELATSQDGVASRAQLRTLGLSDHAIAERIRSGRLHRMHPGIYAIGHAAPSRRGRMKAALLACGAGSAICRRTALEVWDAWRTTDRPIDVVLLHRKRASDGLEIHQTRVLPPEHLAFRDGIVVTTISRTLVDLSLEFDALQIANIIHELAYRRLFDEGDFERCIRRMQASVGTPVALAALAMHRAGSAGTKSELERRVRALLLELGLEAPEANISVNTPIGWVEVDNAWTTHKLYLEVDGPPHARRRTKNADRDRRLGLRSSGWTEIRVGYLELDLDRAGVAARLLARVPRSA
ncbi:MAG: hypothetical protein JWL76_55 [Thermoleophilia bacterium]|nr:hypothetical protein [Thermoleophilia bacterium]